MRDEREPPPAVVHTILHAVADNWAFQFACIRQYDLIICIERKGLRSGGLVKPVVIIQPVGANHATHAALSRTTMLSALIARIYP